MTSIVSRFVSDESGATAIEYGLIAAIVGVGIILSLNSLKTALSLVFTNVATSLTAAAN